MKLIGFEFPIVRFLNCEHVFRRVIGLNIPTKRLIFESEE